MNQVAGQSYNFKDLARFIDDIKFLLARGGEGETIQPPTLTKRIIGWIVFVFLILVLSYVIYVIYALIFRGYSRSLLDFLTLSFSHSVDTNKILGSENEQLYKSIVALQNKKFSNTFNILQQYGYPIGVEKCEDDGCTNVFTNLVYAIDKYYEPNFKSEKTTNALLEYYKYFLPTYYHLSLWKIDSDKRVSRITSIVEQLYKYEELYNDILDIEVQIVCFANLSTTDQQRASKETERIELQNKLKQLFTSFDIKPITTSKDFANYYTAPIYKIKCGAKSLKQFYNEILSHSPHNELRNKVKGIVEKIATKKKELSTSKKNPKIIQDEIVTLKQTKLETEISMARYRKMSQEQAQEQYQQQMGEVMQEVKEAGKQSWKKEAKKTIIKLGTDIKRTGEKEGKKIGNKIVKFFTKKNLRERSDDTEPTEIEQSNDLPTFDVVNTEALFNYSAEYQNIIAYDDESKPLLSKRNDGKQNKIYVPCYHVYEQYVIMNKNKFPDNLSKDECIAYAFMKDYETIQNEDTSDVPVLERILRMQIAMELALKMTSFSFNDEGNIRRLLYYIFLPDNNVLQTAANDIIDNRNNDMLVAYQQNSLDKLYASTVYTWYLMELLCMIHPSNPLTFETCYNQLVTSTNQLSIEKMQSLNTYLNIKMKQEDLIKKLNLEPSLVSFAEKHPLFMTVYLSQVVPINTRSIEGKPNKSMQQQEAILNDVKNKSAKIYTELRQFLSNMMFPYVWINDSIWMEGLSYSLDVFTTNIFLLKEVFINMHILHLYLSTYKTNSGLKQKEKDARLVRDGFSEIINDQQITEEEFFMRLIGPFKNDLIDTRVVGAWRDLLYKDKFKQNSEISYWRDFKTYWIDYMRPKMEKSVKSVWDDVGKSAKIRFT